MGQLPGFSPFVMIVVLLEALQDRLPLVESKLVLITEKDEPG